MYSPYSFNYNITSIFYYKHIDNSLYQKEWAVNVPLPWFHRLFVKGMIFLLKLPKRYEHFKINSLGKEKPTTTLFQQVP